MKNIYIFIYWGGGGGGPGGPLRQTQGFKSVCHEVLITLET